MAVDITWLFGFNTFQLTTFAPLYTTWINSNRTFKDFHSRFPLKAWAGSTASSNSYPTINTFEVDGKSVKGFGNRCGNYPGYQFKNPLTKNPTKRTYFGYRLTAKWLSGPLIDFTNSGITGPDGTGTLSPISTNNLSLPGVTSSIYIEHILTPVYVNEVLDHYIYNLAIDGNVFGNRVGKVLPTATPEVAVGPTADSQTYSYGLNFIISDCYAAEQDPSETIEVFGSLEVSGHLITNVSNDKDMTLQGSDKTTALEELNFFCDEKTLLDKTSSVMLSNMGVENILTFEDVGSSVVGATIRTTLNRGNSANGRVKITSITNAGPGEGEIFTPPTVQSKDFLVVNTHLSKTLTAAEVNGFKVKLETVK